MADNDDLLKAGRDAFEQCEEAEADNRRTALEDIEFARASKQWPENIAKQREADGRPMLTFNKLPAFIRQVVNDARQNKPAIKVHPADDGADIKTAEVMNGIIRNIEYTSNADVAYDTATECAVGGGFGYLRVTLDYAYDDSSDMDLGIARVANPFSVYADPNSQAADSSDWDVAFVTDQMLKAEFEETYKGKATTDWNDDAWSKAGDSWHGDKTVTVAEWWSREKVDRPIVVLKDGTVLDKASLETNDDLRMLLQAGMLEIVADRVAKSCKVTQRIMSGVDILEEREWPGKFIPIIPVYGDEFNIEGKRYLRSLIHNAIDPQRNFNFWRTAAAELLALAPKVPFIGRKGAFDNDPGWATANTKSHPYLEYDGPEAPQRQPLDVGPAAGALQEALNASDDIKAIIGMYDASLGARSNETSGRAILARQREGDVSTFHFIDNMARAIRHTGRVLIDLIPKVYNQPRIVRLIGEDGTQTAKQVNQEYLETDEKTGEPMMEPMKGPDGKPMMEPQMGPDGQPMMGNDGMPMMQKKMQQVIALHDLTVGKYDLTVSTGPSFTTRREEAAAQMTEMMRAMPESVPILGKHLAKNLDWPGADEIAEELEAMSPKPGGPQIPPEVEQMIAEGKQKLEEQAKEIEALKANDEVERAKVASAALESVKRIEADEVIASNKQASAERMKREELASDERIARERLAMEQRLAALKDDGVEVDAPDGTKVVKTRADMGNEALMMGLTQLGQLIVQQGHATAQSMDMLARTISAPVELVRGPDGKAAGARKVLN